MYQVVVGDDRNNPYSLWFRTRQLAREYKKILRKDGRFSDIYIMKRIMTQEGFIVDDVRIF